MYITNDEDLYNLIRINIKHYREKANYTQAKLAEKAGISLSYLSKIEASSCKKSLSISTLNQIANALNVEIIVFFKEVDYQ